jgi:hypothetical protein
MLKWIRSDLNGGGGGSVPALIGVFVAKDGVAAPRNGSPDVYLLLKPVLGHQLMGAGVARINRKAGH